MSNSQLARDMMIPMSQEFVSDLNDGETKLDQEIDDLLNGIDFQKSMSQAKSPNYIHYSTEFSTISIPTKLTKLYFIY